MNTSKAPYQRPELQVYGNVSEMTQTNFGNGTDGGVLGYTLS